MEAGGAGKPGKWTRADCRLCVCVPSVCLPTVRAFLVQNRAVITHGRPGQQLLSVPVPRKLSL